MVLVLLIIFIALTYKWAVRNWREEQAILTEGTFHPCASINTFLHLKIGNSNAVIESHVPNPEADHLFAVGDTSIELWKVSGQYHISATIRDESDREIVEIRNNHWYVPERTSFDKNYNDTALEVKDEGGRVIFQIRFLPECVILQSRLTDGYGKELELYSSGGGGNININPNTEANHPVTITPIFKYPGKDHFGDFEEAAAYQNCDGKIYPTNLGLAE